MLRKKAIDHHKLCAELTVFVILIFKRGSPEQEPNAKKRQKFELEAQRNTKVALEGIQLLEKWVEI